MTPKKIEVSPTAESNSDEVPKSSSATEKANAVDKVKARFDLPAIFITVFFFFQWLPYVLISRLTFIYHYYLDVPFLCLASGYIISKVWPNKWGKVFIIAYLSSAVILFVLFFPVISGLPTSRDWVNHLKLIKGWLLP